MKAKIRINKETGLCVEHVALNETGDDIVTILCPDGLYQPRWNGESWEEGATQEYIDNLKAQEEPQEPTESDRLEALEMLMLDVLGGGF